MPKVSVIIPTHNRADLLPLAIRSVLSQSFTDLEIIIVDDGSKDNTREVVSSFSDKRIKYLRHGINKGLSAARNTGIEASRSNYIAFLDDDDEWLPDKLKKQVDLLESSSQRVGGVYTSYFKVDRASGKTLRQLTPIKRGNIFNEMFTQNWVGPPSTVLLRRECFERVGSFDEYVLYCNDWDLWIRISKEYDFDYIKEPLVRYYVHKNNMSDSSKAEMQIRGIETVLKKYDKLFALNKKTYSEFHLTLGVLYCFNSNTKKGRELFLNAIKLYPFDIRYYYNLGLSLLGADAFKKLKAMRDNLAAPLRSL